MSLIQTIRAKQALEELGINLPVKSLHKEIPETWIGDKKYTLVFPRYMLSYNTEKDINFSFQGLLTPQRRKFLGNFPDMQIIDSKNGRNEETKKTMARTRFSPCPNGNFKWTYRFFEAVIFKSIPIIEYHSPIYDGYKYYEIGDKYEYNMDYVEFNLLKVKQEMMLEINELL
jgi:hypothetical protein